MSWDPRQALRLSDVITCSAAISVLAAAAQWRRAVEVLGRPTGGEVVEGSGWIIDGKTAFGTDIISWLYTDDAGY